MQKTGEINVRDPFSLVTPEGLQLSISLIWRVPEAVFQDAPRSVKESLHALLEQQSTINPIKNPYYPPIALFLFYWTVPKFVEVVNWTAWEDLSALCVKPSAITMDNSVVYLQKNVINIQ